MRIAIDIDGTLFKGGTPQNGYRDARPNLEPIPGMKLSPIVFAKVLFNLGHEIIIYTARGSSTGVTPELMLLTQTQLKEAGVEGSHIIFKKPAADYYVDDKAVSFQQLKELAMKNLKQGIQN